MLAKVSVLKRLDWTGGTTFKMAHSHGWWQKILLSCHVVLIIDLHRPHDMTVDLHVNDASRRVRKKPHAIDNLVLEITHCHFYQINVIKR